MIAFILATTILFDNPDPNPNNGLPFSLPSMPPIPDTEVDDIVFGELEHSEDYADRQTEMESMIDDWTAPITDFNSSLDSFIVEVPDASSGDFTTGFSALTPYGTAYEYAEFTGENVGSLAQYARAGQSVVTDLLDTATGLLVDFMLACAIWLILARVFAFIFNLIMLLWSIGVDIWNSIFNVVPTGG